MALRSTSVRIGPIASQSSTCIPAVTRDAASSQKTWKLASSTLPRMTTRSAAACRPTYSSPTSYWSEKKYGSRSFGTSASVA